MFNPIESDTVNYWRINGLIAAAFAILILIISVTIWIKVESEYTQGILTLVLGRMLGYVDAIYNYEFGTTRSSAKKDATIGELAQTAATVATTAQAVQVAADKAPVAAKGTPDSPIKAADVSIEAKGSVVVQPEKGNSP